MVEIRERKIKIIFFVFISFFSFFARILPHPPNFAPVGALAVMAGTYLPKRYALFLPLFLMFVSDYFIGFYDIKVMAAVYLSFLLYVFLGSFFGKNKKIVNLGGSALLGSILFFLITNFAVWAFTPLYSKDLSGLIMSYIYALPFLKNTLFGDIFYITTFFLLYQYILKVIFLREHILFKTLKLLEKKAIFS